MPPFLSSSPCPLPRRSGTPLPRALGAAATDHMQQNATAAGGMPIAMTGALKAVPAGHGEHVGDGEGAGGDGRGGVAVGGSGSVKELISSIPRLQHLIVSSVAFINQGPVLRVGSSLSPAHMIPFHFLSSAPLLSFRHSPFSFPLSLLHLFPSSSSPPLFFLSAPLLPLHPSSSSLPLSLPSAPLLTLRPSPHSPPLSLLTSPSTPTSQQASRQPSLCTLSAPPAASIPIKHHALITLTAIRLGTHWGDPWHICTAVSIGQGRSSGVPHGG
ncbi:unnamed protein product [Closterium sp. NIES-64]|nr:unnamed protein product [Closterium sp. NIES-64]